MTNGDGWGKHFSADERCMYWLLAHPYLFNTYENCYLKLPIIISYKVENYAFCWDSGGGMGEGVVQNREPPDFRSSEIGISTVNHKLDCPGL